jgi:hypothetical protein
MAGRLYNNLPTNYSIYYNTLEFFRQLLSLHPSVQRVTYGDVMEMDLDVFPQYPLANIDISDATFGDKKTTYSIKLMLLDKIHNKENTSSGSLNQETEDFWKHTDEVDIHANTLSVLNDFISFLRRGTTAFDIVGDVRCVAIKQEYPNNLAGWGADFLIETPNDNNICLFDFSGSLDENC